jgi:hypothetical protein
MGSTSRPLAGRRVPRGEIALAIAGLSLSIAVWLHATGPGVGAGYDFSSYVQAARTIEAGGNPYARLIAEYAAAHSHVQGVAANGYVYPPLLAALLAVPVWLGLGPTGLWVLWNLVVSGLMLWMGYECSRLLRPRARLSVSLAFTALALLPAVATYDLWLGQADLLMAALAVGAEGLRLRGHPAAPLALGLAIAVKPLLLPVLAVWLWKRDWKAAVWGFAAAVVLLLAPFLVAGGWAGLRDYLYFLRIWNGVNGSAEFINQSIYGMLLRTLTANPYIAPVVVAPALVVPLRYGLVLAGAGLWLWSVPRQPTMDHALALGDYLIALPLLLVASPLSEDIHFCLLIPALVGLSWLAVSQNWLRRPGWVGPFGVLCALLRATDAGAYLPGQPARTAWPA